MIRTMTKALVINHNALDRAIYSMSPIELKLMHYCITKVRRDGGYAKTNRLFEIRHEDFAGLIGRDNCYSSMKAAVKRLQQQIVTINEPITDADGVTHAGGAINVLSAQYWAENEGYIKLEFSDRFMPYLTKLAGDYNKLFFEEIGRMKSSHSIKLYKLIRNQYNINKKYGNNDALIVEVDDLRTEFELKNKYKLHSNFRKFVIEQAIDEINQLSPLLVEYRQLKKGRRIHAYEFKIRAKSESFSLQPTKNKNAVQKAMNELKKALSMGLDVRLLGQEVREINGAIVSFKNNTSMNLYNALIEADCVFEVG